MINIKEIVEKIKASYPKIRVEEKVKINEQFTADYIIIQGLKIKAIFIPFKKIPDNLWENYVKGENSEIAYYYDSSKIYIASFQLNGATLQELTNIDLIFTPFKNEIIFNQFELLEKHKTILDMFYRFEHNIIELDNSESGLVNLENELKLLRLIDHNKGGFTHHIKWDEYHEKDSLIPSWYNSGRRGQYYNIAGKFEMSLIIKFTPFSDEELVKRRENLLTVEFYAKGRWLHFLYRESRRESYKSSEPLLIDDIYNKGSKMYEYSSIENDLNLHLDYFRLSNDNKKDTTEMHWESNLNRLQTLLKKTLSTCKAEGIKRSYFD